MLDLMYFMAVAVFLFGWGLYMVASKKNYVKILMGIEIMLAASNLSFIAIGASMAEGSVDPLSHAIVLLSMSVGAAVASVAVAIAMLVYRHYGTLNTEKMNRLRG